MKERVGVLVEPQLAVEAGDADSHARRREILAFFSALERLGVFFLGEVTSSSCLTWASAAGVGLVSDDASARARR